MNKYSVLMSLYLKEKPEYLKIAIQSMLHQTIPPDEIIIVKDGSVTPGLQHVLDEYISTYPQLFTIVGYPENQGLAFALNYGLKHARNELIARMDTDDYSLPDRCEKQLKVFKLNPNLALLGGSVQFFKTSPDASMETYRKFPAEQEDIKRYIRKNSAFSHPTVMFRKSAVEACGCYDEQLRRSQDHDLFSKMIAKGFDCQNINQVLVCYRMDGDAVLRNRNKESCKARVIIQKRIYERNQCSFLDYLYIRLAVWMAQALPEKLYIWIYSRIKDE